jgi:hypothetical protein
MITITACLYGLTLLALSISAIAGENMTASISQTQPGINNTTLGNNNSMANNTTQEDLADLAYQIPPSNNATTIDNTIAGMNASQENATNSLPAIHVGMASTKPINTLGRLVPKETNNVDVFGNKSTYNISAYSNTKPTYDISASYIRLLHAANSTVKPLFNVEDRNPTTPFWTAPSDTSANTIEDVSVYNQSESVRDLSGYPVIMVPSNMA